MARSEEQLQLFLELATRGGAEPYLDTRRPEAFREEQRAGGKRTAARRRAFEGEAGGEQGP